MQFDCVENYLLFYTLLFVSGNADDNMLLAKLESVYTGSGDHGSSMVSFHHLNFNILQLR